ncbi:hypothetical protein KC726_02470 [Candidatus Woesebacteria bacterium]|nr:hypothetical protein [Candidatus Woesebacteria bacterium]
MKKSIIFAVVAFCILSMTQTACVQAFSVSTSPPYYAMSAPPGQSFSLPIKITNLKDPFNAQLSIQKLVVVDEQGSLSLEPLAEEHAVHFFIRGDDEIQTDKPFLFRTQSSHTITLDVYIDREANENDYYYALVAEAVGSQDQTRGLHISLQPAIAVPLFISVAQNEIPYKAKTVFFKPRDRRFDAIVRLGDNVYIADSLEPLKLVYTLANTGIHRFETMTKLSTRFASPLFTKKNEIALKKTAILPSTQKMLHDTDNADNDFTSELPRKILGMYTVESATTIGDGNAVLFEHITIVIFPFSVIILLIVVVLSILIYRKSHTSTTKIPRGRTSIFMKK